MANEKIIKKFNKLTKEELRARREEKLKDNIKRGVYFWNTEEERASQRPNQQG